jgi:DnaK suppressor protein
MRAARTPPTSHRERVLRHFLEDQRLRLLGVTRERIGRSEEARNVEAGIVGDTGDKARADIQEELDFALIEMYSQTMKRIDRALERLDAGVYGCCTDCGADIAASRLEALPFVDRCRSCQERLERNDANDDVSAAIKSRRVADAA